MSVFNKEKDICSECGTILKNYINIDGERTHITEIIPDLLELFTKKNLLNKG